MRSFSEPYVIEMLPRDVPAVKNKTTKPADHQEAPGQAGAGTATPDRRGLRKEHARDRLASSEVAVRLLGSGGLRLLAWTALLGLVLSLAFAAEALASRRPTSIERKAITSVAARVPHAGGGRVHVSGIRVSTVGPWALAELTIDVDGYPDTAVDILHKVHGKWRNASFGSDPDVCVMPRTDRQNLGFGASEQCGKQGRT